MLIEKTYCKQLQQILSNWVSALRQLPTQTINYKYGKGMSVLDENPTGGRYTGCSGVGWWKGVMFSEGSQACSGVGFIGSMFGC